MTELEEFLAGYEEGTEPVIDPFYEYSQVDDTFIDIENKGRDIVDYAIPLLPSQIEFMNDTSSKVLGLFAGFGSGKTFILCHKALQLMSLNPGADIIMTEPNFPLLVQILFPEMNKVLIESGLPWKFKSSEGIYYVQSRGQTTRIICKSLENTDRMIGINACAVLTDEFDVTKTELAYKAFIMLVGRLRAGSVRQWCTCSTPEGFKAAYRIFVAEERGRMIKARTTDNVFLPDDFVQTLYDTYPPHLVDAYINGEFVNMTSGSVFGYFDRVKNNAAVTLSEDDKEIWVGGDFNSGGSVTLQGVMVEGKLYIFGEIVTKDTFETRDRLKAAFPGCKIWGCFDATGNKTTSNSSQSDLDILAEAGVSLMQGISNPHLNDSILSVNNAFIHKNVYIDVDKCPKLTAALEQHAYDAKTGKPDKFMGPATIDDFTDALRYLIWVTHPITKISFGNYNSLGNQR